MEYKKVDELAYANLKKMVSEDRIFFKDAISQDYSHDEMAGINSMPDLLIKVKSINEVSNIVKYAYDKHIPIIARGSGTGLVGGSIAIIGGIMLDFTLMNKIKELDEDNLTVTVEPGVLLMDLAAFVEQHDFLYPPDPGEKSATIGGNINTNAGGMRAVKYGVTRDYIRGLTVVLANGEILTLGGKTVKNSSGYNLMQLISGSEGTLAIVVEAILKLVPLAKISTSLLLPFPSMEQAIDTVPIIIKSKSSLTAIEFFEKDSIEYAEQYLGRKFPNKNAPAYLLLTVDGNEEIVINNELKKVAELCCANGAIDAYIINTDERKESVWKPRGSFLEAFKASTSEIDECDVVVPRNKIGELIKYTHEISKQLNIRIPSFGHAGDGNLHIYVCRDNLDKETYKNKLKQAFELMYKKGFELKGHVSGEHGIGYAKKEYLKMQLPKEQIELMKNIKKAFDPTNILNPGKLFD